MDCTNIPVKRNYGVLPKAQDNTINETKVPYITFFLHKQGCQTAYAASKFNFFNKKVCRTNVRRAKLY